MRPFKPGISWLTVTRRCNFRCRWCYAKGTEYRVDDDMTLESAVKLTSVIKEAGVKKVLLIGGEPTLWRPLTDFNRWCREQGIKTVLVTNGVMFGSDVFWSRYRQSPNDTIGLSLKAVTLKQLKDVAQVDNFDLVRRGIARAVGEAGAHVNITYSTLCADELVEMAGFVSGLGARSVKVEFCSTTFSKGHPSAKYTVDTRTLVKNIVRDYPTLDSLTRGKISLDLMLPLCVWPEGFIRDLYAQGRLLSVCHVHKRAGIIFDREGNLLMCNALFDYPIGRFGRDFSDGDSLKAWIESPRVSGYFDSVGRYPSLACVDCAWYPECGGGCPLRWATCRPDDVVRPKDVPLVHC